MTYYPIITSSRISKGYGYTVGGTGPSAVVEKYDDVSNLWDTKLSITTARYGMACFSLNGYGYASGGDSGASSTVTEKYNTILNIWITVDTLNTARTGLGGFSLNGYGYAEGGDVPSAVVEKYDDVLNTWTAKTGLVTATGYAAGISLNGYGIVSSGNGGAIVTQKYDDVLDTWTLRADMITAGRSRTTGFSLNAYGYTFGGINAGTSTEKYNDINNTWVSVTNCAATEYHSGFYLNGYGYRAGGDGPSAVVAKYDDVLNTWTAKTSLTTARARLGAFSTGDLSKVIQIPELQELSKEQMISIISVDQTASRAIDGTAYTNTSSYNLYVTVSAKCYIDTQGSDSYIQAFSDTNADPVTAASGIVGIEAGLDETVVSVELSFIVRPYEIYKVLATTTAGSTTTNGKWFETPLR